MKRISPFLAVACIFAMLLPTCLKAQGLPDKSISQLKEEIRKLESVALDPSTTPEVRQINEKFLRERREQLQDLLKKRIASLKKYQLSLGDSLTEREMLVVENSIRELES